MADRCAIMKESIYPPFKLQTHLFYFRLGSVSAAFVVHRGLRRPLLRRRGHLAVREHGGLQEAQPDVAGPLAEDQGAVGHHLWA